MNDSLCTVAFCIIKVYNSVESQLIPRISLFTGYASMTFRNISLVPVQVQCSFFPFSLFNREGGLVILQL